LASPFLPAEADVKLAVSYANGKLTGSYTPVGPPLIFQPEPYLNMDWDAAAIYAEYLEIDGVTVSETPQSIWHIPTIEELFSVIDYLTFNPAADISKVPDIQSGGYWSSTTGADGTTLAWGVGFYGGDVYLNAKTGSLSIRCVRQ
jgi:hypothetical protein